MKLQDVINQTCHEDYERRLFRAVIEQMDCGAEEDWTEVWDRPEDFRDASAGVSGFIYYADTSKFFRDNAADILLVLWDFEREMGEPLVKDESSPENWMSWFALEHIIDRIMTLKESMAHE